MSDQLDAAGHTSTSRTVSSIVFVRPIPVLGSALRQDRFDAAEGWTIDVHDYGVTLARAPSQNVPAIDAFCTCGVGYSVPVAVEAASVVPVAQTYAEVAAVPRKGRR